MYVSNKYYQDSNTRKTGTRNFAYMGYTDILSDFLHSQQKQKLQSYLADDFEDLLDE
ncbi:MAG: hypothetical protein VKJ04_11140 [Vampirovibrionales bacterium]|nr:hypothetical protein [Vampirovibrionales bacterium]